MNRFEKEMFEKEFIKIIFSYSKKDINSIYPERTKERKRDEYKKLAVQLKKIKDSKEKELPKEEITYSYVEPVYTDEDKEFLKQAIKSGELTIFDLTYDEAFLAGFTSSDYCKACRLVYSQIIFTKKKKESEFLEKLSKMSSPTPHIIKTLYKQIQKKK